MFAAQIAINLFYYYKSNGDHWTSTKSTFVIDKFQKPNQLGIQSRSIAAYEPQRSTISSGDLSILSSSSSTSSTSIIYNNNNSDNNNVQGKYKGVAVCLFLHTPTWFQRRYTMMIRNIRDNVPADWAVQIFYTGKGQSLNGVDINKGLKRMIDRNEVILTTIPESISAIKRKQFEVWTERWIWENMVADKVLTFGGSASICGNSPHTIENFLHFDYIGAPWGVAKGNGGDGGISVRTRQAMLDVIDYELAKSTDKEAREVAYKNWGQEDVFFVTRLIELNKKQNKNNKNKSKNREENDNVSSNRSPLYRIATLNETMTFAAIDKHATLEVFAASGILGGIQNTDRDKFLQFCPELKMLYPSLHDPNCFGASPDGEQCAKSICALKDKTERKGGC